MAMHGNTLPSKVPNPLQDLFQSWKIGRRETIWLWLILSARGHTFFSNDIDTLTTKYDMVDLIKNERLIQEIETNQSLPLLPEEGFNWIEKSGRQPDWLLSHYPKIHRRWWRNMQQDRDHGEYQEIPPSAYFPPGLSPKEELIALIDFQKDSIPSIRKKLVLKLKEEWATQQEEDRRFSWYFSSDKEKMKQRCKTAWQWYRENHRRETEEVIEFSQQKDVLIFLDRTRFSLTEKLYHLDQIKKKFTNQDSQAKRQAQGKKQTNLSLSDEARRQLDELARAQGRTKTDVIERLISQAHSERLA